MTSKSDEQMAEEDYLDRFKKVSDGLGIKKTIADKVGCFIHYEIQTALRQARIEERERCAKVAETNEIEASSDSEVIGNMVAREKIAQAIRRLA